MLMPIAAAVPVIFAFIPAFILHWKAVPEGLSCRHFWVLGFFFLWIVSAIITTALYGRLSPRVYFWTIYAKDALIGLGCVTMVFLSVVGLYNSCDCWTLSIWLGKAAAYFPLSKAQYFEWKKTTFRTVVGIFLGLQLSYVLLVIFLLRDGLEVNRWGEKWKRVEWQRMNGPWGRQAINMILPWDLRTGWQRRNPQSNSNAGRNETDMTNSMELVARKSCRKSVEENRIGQG